MSFYEGLVHEKEMYISFCIITLIRKQIEYKYIFEIKICCSQW